VVPVVAAYERGEYGREASLLVPGNRALGGWLRGRSGANGPEEAVKADVAAVTPVGVKVDEGGKKALQGPPMGTIDGVVGLAFGAIWHGRTPRRYMRLIAGESPSACLANHTPRGRCKP
jgi:hypothetical protein